jgi:hypothetical protein
MLTVTQPGTITVSPDGFVTVSNFKFNIGNLNRAPTEEEVCDCLAIYFKLVLERNLEIKNEPQ